MSQDWTNQHQRRYAIDNSSIQNPLLQRSCLCKKGNAIENKKTQKEEEKPLSSPIYNNDDKLPEIDIFYAEIQGNLKFCSMPT